MADFKNKAITSRDVDFERWYTDVVKAAKLAEYSSVKGCMILEPNGYAIWEEIQKNLDKMFKQTGHQNVYMPMFIPESLMKKEGELIEGFAPEGAWVTEGGSNKLEERLIVRPTSETMFSDYYALKVKSYRDLPKLYNQWVNVVRWEKETRPFLRTREFLWQEGHTVHETAREAEEETRRMLDVYKTFFEDYLAIPVVTGLKTEKEKFAGAEYTLTVEALMWNGVALQSGTSHYFGQKFSKAYDIKFLNRQNEWEYAYQTSWGVTTRMIGGLIMVHSDDQGLVLPPKIAPRQVVIVPIGDTDEIKELCDKVYGDLLKNAVLWAMGDAEPPFSVHGGGELDCKLYWQPQQSRYVMQILNHSGLGKWPGSVEEYFTVGPEEITVSVGDMQVGRVFATELGREISFKAENGKIYFMLERIAEQELIVIS